jgi:two-component system response regulator PilR (NtrC family)
MDDLHYLHNSYDQTHRPAIIIVEDDPSFSKIAKLYIEKSFLIDVYQFDSPDDCLEFIQQDESFQEGRFFCLVTDITFENQNKDGLLLIDWLRDQKKNFVPIVMTGFASIESAINATKKGVFHYLTKPFDLEVLKDLVAEALEKNGRWKASELLKSESVSRTSRVFADTYKIEAPQAEDVFCGMIGRSAKMKEVFARITKVAESNSTVLISGPSGTGKELVTQAIHELSHRKESSLVSVNCGAIPSELLESELFGHEKGAFTGAISSRKGRFEHANHGSIFLDEIGDMPLLLQVKLLRVLQSRMIERVGGNETIPVDVRIIAATHRDLEKAVINGDFREDLFYRLNVIPIKIPALKERKEDIPILISYFLRKFASADGRNMIKFEDEAFEVMMNYDWPGNVRELENLIERLVILKGGSSIKLQDLPDKFLGNNLKTSGYEQLLNLPESGLDLKRVISDIEDSLIFQALERTSWNKNQASKLLSMNRTTLIEKIKKKSLENRIPK